MDTKHTRKSFWHTCLIFLKLVYYLEKEIVLVITNINLLQNIQNITFYRKEPYKNKKNHIGYKLSVYKYVKIYLSTRYTMFSFFAPTQFVISHFQTWPFPCVTCLPFLNDLSSI
uniref:Uncharacterized protein n=1 Tax=Anguilla anguilla TaxID=7936 RepID=A0A0E9XD83_ANGAN